MSLIAISPWILVGIYVAHRLTTIIEFRYISLHLAGHVWISNRRELYVRFSAQPFKTNDEI